MRDQQPRSGSGPVAQFPAGLYRLVMWTIEAGQALFFDPEKDAALPEDLYYNEVGRALLVPITSGDAPIGRDPGDGSGA